MSSAQIFIVEDDRDIRRNLCRLFQSEGYAVEAAENGQVALEQLQKAADLPSLIVLDLMMPVMDGFQFREEQRRIPRLADIPILVMTADGHFKEKQAKLGARAGLGKPPDIDAILKLAYEICGPPK
jgi:CheY-like chemotaxis protein